MELVIAPCAVAAARRMRDKVALMAFVFWYRSAVVVEWVDLESKRTGERVDRECEEQE